MKRSIFAVVLLGMMVMVAVDAHAITMANIDGFNNGEWINLNLMAIDPNESVIDDKYDIWQVGMIVNNNGDANDGLYIGWLLFDTPTFNAYPSVGSNRPSYRTILDFNLNGIEDGNDRRIDYAWIGGVPTLTVYDSALNVISGSTLSAMGTSGANAGVEWFIPESMFSAPISKFQAFMILDNGGNPGEDYLPDQGWTTSTPEPGSMALLGMGLLGFVGALRRKFKA